MPINRKKIPKEVNKILIFSERIFILTQTAN